MINYLKEIFKFIFKKRDFLILLVTLIGFTQACWGVSYVENQLSSLSKTKHNHSQIEKPFSQNTIPLFISTHEGCEGSIDLKEALAICSYLKNHAPLGIEFSENRMDHKLVGGTCSAISLEFLEDYLKLKKQNLSDASLIQAIQKLGIKYQHSSQKMRTRQAAYNTISVNKKAFSTDYLKAKIQALANYHQLKVDYTSNLIDIRKVRNGSHLDPLLTHLPEGVYILRQIEPCRNQKLEKQGHTYIYIKESDLNIFFDPNKGAVLLNPGHRYEELFISLKEYYNSYHIYQFRFYLINIA